MDLTNKVTKQAEIFFQDNGAPYSKHFDDIYFDTETGCQQSKDVFIKGNNIEQRLLASEHDFTVAETGFGTGVNFLLTLKIYQKLTKKLIDDESTKSLTKLSFISTEKYPLSKEQLIKSLAILPELAEQSKLLIEQYPEKPFSNNAEQKDQIQLSFLGGKVSLTLLFNDSAYALSQLTSPKFGLVDAWYLDGFSPRKNPDMWSDALFTQIARLSKEQASISTFTIAGMVRRPLIKVGFRVEKKSTEGRKREILVGLFQQSKTAGKGYQLRPQITKPQHVSIIGGGIAAACAAYSLTKNGVKVTLYCKDNSVAQGASSNDIGAIYPLLHQKQDDISLFYQQAFWHAKATYQNLNDQGFHFAHDWCGLLDIAFKPTLQKHQQQFEQLNAWPSELIHGVDNIQASKLANIQLAFGGLFMPHAGWIAPAELVKALFDAASKTNRLRIETNTHITEISQIEKSSLSAEEPKKQWLLSTTKGDFKESVLIVCGGADSIKINIINELPLTSVRGQVSSMKSNDTLSALSTVICHKGYLTPANKHQQHCIGATFDKNSFDIETAEKDDDYNIDMLNTCLPGVSNWTREDVAKSKARLRCMTPDHLPVVGAMPNIEEHIINYAHLRKDKNWRFDQAAPTIDNLYVMTGLGARGLCSAPLIADILTADICGTPYPVDSKMLFNLAPNRFIIRDLIKRKI